MGDNLHLVIAVAQEVAVAAVQKDHNVLTDTASRELSLILKQPKTEAVLFFIFFKYKIILTQKGGRVEHSFFCLRNILKPERNGPSSLKSKMLPL